MRKAKHGQHKTRTYGVWEAMKARCLNKNDKAYKNYGGRGITVCERWIKFENFLLDMGHAPLGLSLDRINNDGPYQKDNCRWTTRVEQQCNRRDNRFLSYRGQTKVAEHWAKEFGIPSGVFHNRIFQMGWPIERALTEPVAKNRGHDG